MRAMPESASLHDRHDQVRPHDDALADDLTREVDGELDERLRHVALHPRDRCRDAGEQRRDACVAVARLGEAGAIAVVARLLLDRGHLVGRRQVFGRDARRLRPARVGAPASKAPIVQRSALDDAVGRDDAVVDGALRRATARGLGRRRRRLRRSHRRRPCRRAAAGRRRRVGARSSGSPSARPRPPTAAPGPSPRGLPSSSRPRAATCS